MRKSTLNSNKTNVSIEESKNAAEEKQFKYDLVKLVGSIVSMKHLTENLTTEN